MRRISCLFVAMLFSTQVFAVQTFEKRFKVVRNEEGKVVSIKEPTLFTQFSIKPYIEFIKESLQTEQALMKQKGDYDAMIEEMLAPEFMEKGDKSSQNIGYVVNSMRQLESLDIDGIFNSPEFKEVIAQYEKKLGDAISYIDPTIIAKPDNSRFFYKRHVTYQAVKWALDFAKKRLSTVPLLNTASYVLVEVERMVSERRLYHQNMLLHYLEMYPESELGLTKEEADQVFSSIYEAHIPWYAKWESDAAAGNWSKYGTNKFYTGFRGATAKLRSNRYRYSSMDKRLNYAFQEVVDNGENQIINLIDSEAMFNSKPAVAYIVNSPNKIARKRMVLQLAGLGVSFIPLPNFIKDLASKYMKSFYEKQKITEGALFAHFEIAGNQEMMQDLKVQYMNPFDQSLILE
ncbi:hypothetical protein [Halobacteriovorax sp. HLS]|uniref:hypothetical protein n=1 Tax=Halobacteriovorax sp. HLS TaxID=2234000 RepID=UPI000FD81D77|nr:hypothetical protein [Halobacteriovorax sp. HLS]